MVAVMALGEYVPSIVVTVLFCTIIPWGVDVWIKADTVITSMFGLVILFFPDHFLNRQVSGKLDDVHLHVYRMCGIMILCSSLFAILTRKSKNTVVVTTMLQGRVVGVSVYIITRIYSYAALKGVQKWNRQALVFGIYGDCLWLTGNVIYMVKSTDLSGKKLTQLKENSFYLQLDYLLCILFGFAFYLVPETILGFQTLKTLDNLHVTLVRMMAAFVLNTGMIAWRSCYFLTEKDQECHFISRVVTNIGLFTVQLYAGYEASSSTTWPIYFVLIITCLWSCNAALGILSLCNKKKQTFENSDGNHKVK